MKNNKIKSLQQLESSITLLSILLISLVFFTISNQLEACADVLPIKTSPPPEPHCCRCSDDCQKSPTFVKNGNYVTSFKDLQLPTRGFPLDFTRNYDTMRAIDGLMGNGWSANVLSRLTYATFQFSPPSTYFNEAVIVMPSGRILHFRENPDGVTFQPQVESHDTLVKNGDGTFDLTPELTRSRYHYSSSGALLTMIDDYGNTLTYTYDGNGKPQRVTDSGGSGRYLDFIYGGDGRISAVQDSAGRSVQFSYVSGNMTSVTDAEGRVTTYSYTAGQFVPSLSRITDNWGRVVSDITYDSLYRVASYTENGETYTYSYAPANSQTTKTSSTGNPWIFTYDAAGRVTDSFFPNWATYGFHLYTSYYPDGSVQQEIDAAQVKTYYTYNANGSVASISRDYQGGGTGSAPVRFDYTYDSNFPEKVIAITPKNPSTGAINRDWQEWKYDYYAAGSAAPSALFHVYRVKSDGIQSTIATYSYNSYGQIATVTDAVGAVTSYAYNGTTGDLISITYPKNSASGPNPIYQYGRDTAGRVMSTTDPLLKITNYTYDDLDRILTVTLPKPSVGSPLNFVTTYTYDNFDVGTGLVFTHQIDANGKNTKQGYDQYGQMIKSIDASNNVTNFDYSTGLLASITDANGNFTDYNYDQLKRLQSTIFSDGTTETNGYTADGLLNLTTNRKNQQTSFVYDNLKRVTAKNYLSGGKSYLFTYVGQKLTRARISVSPVPQDFDYTYDTSYRIATDHQTTRGDIIYTYDAADRVGSYTVTGGPTANYTYYPDGSLNTITWSLVSGQFQYNYTLNGEYASITFPNGQHRDYNYDDQGRLLSMANIHPQAGNLATYAYGYDTNHYTGLATMLGQRSNMNATVPSQSFNNHQTKYYYDTNYQLTKTDYPNVAPFSGEVDSWTYDPIGNRLTNTVNGSTQNYTYYTNSPNPNNGQRLQSDGVNTYTYDNNGNTITKTGGYTYGWDFDNKMTALNGPSLTTTYEYDYLGRRGKKVVNGATTNYLYDGQNLIREMGTTTAEFLFGPGIDEPLAMVRSGVTYYYNADGLGSINVMNDSPGTVQNKYVLDVWGIAKSQTIPISNPFTYTAREVGEAGQMYYRARYYNPSVGRFVSEDPAASDETPPPQSLYAYADNMPVTFIDPSGETSEPILPRPELLWKCVKGCLLHWPMPLTHTHKLFVAVRELVGGDVSLDAN